MNGGWVVITLHNAFCILHTKINSILSTLCLVYFAQKKIKYFVQNALALKWNNMLQYTSAL